MNATRVRPRRGALSFGHWPLTSACTDGRPGCRPTRNVVKNSHGFVRGAPRPRRTIEAMYDVFFDALGPQKWWPARTSFEVMVGAILTQATRWDNVEEVIRRLRVNGGLTPRGLLRLPKSRLLQCLRPSGYFRQKAKRLRDFVLWYVRRYGGSAVRLSRRPTRALREELLALVGIGPETADSILLYALNRPVFVVDAYARRILSRHRLMREPMSYTALQERIMQRLAPNRKRYNEFHALLVEVGKRYCHRRHPKCTICPLQAWPRTIESIERSV